MKKRMYSVRDHKAGFWPPMEDINDAVAQRNFSYLLHNNQQVGFAPMDYDLYFVGNFDDVSGIFEPEKVPQFICGAGDVYEKS